MARLKKKKIYNIIFLVLIALLIIPQTRQPIQVFFNKAMAGFITPSVIEGVERKSISSYNWKLQEISGQQFDFNSARGKVVVINFWATWCPPCIAEMSSLQALYEHYQDNNEVLFLYVSNEESEVINRFMTKKNFTFNVYQSITQYPSEFNITSIPRTFIIDKEGKIVVDKSGPANWNDESVISIMEELLKAF